VVARFDLVDPRRQMSELSRHRDDDALDRAEP
jgi:hypothetical protein